MSILVKNYNDLLLAQKPSEVAPLKIDPVDPLSLTLSDKIHAATNMVQWGITGAALYGVAPQITTPISFLAGLGSEIISFRSLPEDTHWSRQILSIPGVSRFIRNYSPWASKLFQVTSLFNLAQYSLSKLSTAWKAFTTNPSGAIKASMVHLFNLASSVAFTADSLNLIHLQKSAQTAESQKCLKQLNPFQCDLQRQCLRPVDLYKKTIPPQCPGKTIIKGPAHLTHVPCAPKAMVNLPCDGCGMFSVQLYLTGVLGRLNNGRYSGMKIDFGKEGLGYAEEQGPNWFEYYYCPVDIEVENCSGTSQKTFTNAESSDHCHYSDHAWEYEKRNGLPYKEARELIQKHFLLRPEIQEEIDQFAQSHFPKERHLITVHYRGTDKAGYTDAYEARRVSYSKMGQTIRNYIQTLKPEDRNTATIFVATDEEGFAKFAQLLFPHQVVISPSRKSTDGKPLHFGAIDRYQTGKEAIVDCHLLSKGDALIRTSSNLSKMAAILLKEGAREIQVSEQSDQDSSG